MIKLENILKPGDALLYAPSSIFGWVIAVKTGSKRSHMEIYAGNGMSVASRDGIGVGKFPLRTANLAAIFRPPAQYNHRESMTWFETVNGQKYDWKGLLVTTLAVNQGSLDRMFCSEYATRHYRRGNVEPFQKEFDADRVVPMFYELSSQFTPITFTQSDLENA